MGQIEKLQAEIEDLDDELKGIQEKIKEAESELDDIQDDIDTLEKDKKSLDDEDLQRFIDFNALQTPHILLTKFQMIDLRHPGHAQKEAFDFMCEALGWEGYQDVVDYFNESVLPVISSVEEFYEIQMDSLVSENNTLQDEIGELQEKVENSEYPHIH